MGLRLPAGAREVFFGAALGLGVGAAYLAPDAVASGH